MSSGHPEGKNLRIDTICVYTVANEGQTIVHIVCKPMNNTVHHSM